jgi:hypothetical protein
MTRRLRLSRFGMAILLCALSTSVPAAQSDPLPPALIEKTLKANFPEFFELLALPNDAIDANAIRKNADWLEAAFRKARLCHATTRQ